jgi:hypothetical protein
MNAALKVLCSLEIASRVVEVVKGEKRGNRSVSGHRAAILA